MTFTNEFIDSLLADYKKLEDLIGKRSSNPSKSSGC